ncbi:hypothetical protein [Patulibacter minatonensis]|uniref:hypothetical protein n=1 Tax=Patulibacter minatonensis TaxID=298163 RepID=UPI00047A5B5E|nr:hypothetical protein [Patulibacter minatonensis]
MTLAYVRLGLDRALPIPPGRNVIAAGPSGARGDRVTGVARDQGGADVLDLEVPEPEKVSRTAPKRRRRAPDPAGTRFVVTLVRASEPLDASAGASVLEGWRRDEAEAQRWVGAALAAVNRAIRAQRLVHRDPYAVEVTLDDVVWAAVGCAAADVLAVGGAGEQLSALPRSRGRMTSSQRAQPGETVGLALTGGLPLLEGEELVAFAVREANHGRVRSALAALDAAGDLLAEELSGLAATRVGSVDVRIAAEPEAILTAAEQLQDVVDRWRSGEDPTTTADVERAAEAEQAAIARHAHAQRSGDLPRS